jgi:transposase
MYAGLDLGSTGCVLCAKGKDGAPPQWQEFTTGEKGLRLAVMQVRGRPLHVALEAGELAGWAYRILKSISRVEVVVCDPKTNAWIAKDPNKNDPVDAGKLCDLLMMGKLKPVYYAVEEDRAVFKELMQHHLDLTHHVRRLKNQIKSRFRQQGVLRIGPGIFGEEGRAKWLLEVPSPEVRESIRPLYGMLDETLEAQRKALQQMVKYARRYPEIERFREVPGIDWVLACRFSAIVQTPHRFRNVRKLWRYCRLGIVHRVSDGKLLGPERLDYNGNGVLKDVSRKAFIAAVLTSQEDNHFKRACQQTLKNTGDATHARLTVQRKIVATLWSMWKGGTRYRDAIAG